MQVAKNAHRPGSARFDFHAYAVVALDHRMLLELPLDDTYDLAAAAIRQAEAAMQSPDLVEMPRLPGVSASAPDVVRLHARACLRPESADKVRQSCRDDNLG